MNNSNFTPDWLSPTGESILCNAFFDDAEAISKRIGVSKRFLLCLTEGIEEINENLAERLAAQFGGTSSFWIKREELFRERLNTLVMKGDPRASRLWLKQFPITEMVKRGWITITDDLESQVESCLNFFGVETPSELRLSYFSRGTQLAFRTSPTYTSRMGSLFSWIRQSERTSGGDSVSEFSPYRLQSSIDELRSLTLYRKPKDFLPKIKSILASCGVIFVSIKQVSGCPVSGATFQRGDGTPMIVQSFRFKSDDHFWFTFFHELGHLLLHDLSDGFFEGVEEETCKEYEANEFAALTLIPEAYGEQLTHCVSSKYSVARFARRIGLAPGIVVGQLQHQGLIRRNSYNFLKTRYSAADIQEH